MEAAAATVIDAPREAVVEIVDDPETQQRVTPALTGIADVQQKSDGGRRMLYGYAVFGLVLTGVLETTVYEPPERVHFEMRGRFDGEIRWTFESLADDRTRFRYAASYDLSWLPLRSLTSPLVTPLVAWYTRRDLRRAVENTRELVEAETRRDRDTASARQHRA